MNQRGTATTAEAGLHTYLRMLARRKALVAACVIVVLVTTLAASFLQTLRYEASTDVLIRQRTGATLLDAANTAQNQRPQMENERGLAESGQVTAAVEELLDAVPAVEISYETESDILTFRATSTDADSAANIANAYARAFIDVRRTAMIEEYVASGSTIQEQVVALDAEIDELRAERNAVVAAIPFDAPDRDQQIAAAGGDIDARISALDVERGRLVQLISNLDLSAELVQGGGATVISPAEAPDQPYEPATERNAALALIIGLLLGVGAALLLENLDTSVRDADALKASTGLKNLAVVPEAPGSRRGSPAGLVTQEQPNSPAAEAYRALRTSVQFLSIDAPVRTLQVTSPKPGDGKTTTACNLAVATARAGTWVVLVDCDLRKPRVHEYFDLPNEQGFTNVLLGEAELVDVGQRIPDEPNLVVITSGPVPPDPSELLSGRRARMLLSELAERSELLIIDSPPVLPVSDPLVLSSHADGVVLVASAGSDRGRIRSAVEQLEQVDAPMLGTVLNRFEARRSGGYGYGYGDSYGTYVAPVATADVRRPAIRWAEDDDDRQRGDDSATGRTDPTTSTSV